MQSAALKYPYQPGFQFRDTSKRAANEAKANAETLREQCLKALREMPRTADEVAKKLNETVLAVRPRITELNKQGLIKDSGWRRQNESKKSAIVWIAN